MLKAWKNMSPGYLNWFFWSLVTVWKVVSVFSTILQTRSENLSYSIHHFSRRFFGRTVARLLHWFLSSFFSQHLEIIKFTQECVTQSDSYLRRPRWSKSLVKKVIQQEIRLGNQICPKYFSGKRLICWTSSKFTVFRCVYFRMFFVFLCLNHPPWKTNGL